MNLARIYQLSGTGLLAISLTLLSLTSSVKAQTDVQPDVEPNIAVIEEEDGFDWGLLGLLGLLGLGGLAGKNNSDRHEVRNIESFPEAPKRTR
ncbi:WGxxGxxG family protein [Pleurocapsa sp. PCC 7319]|uniref:WGxxGxxG family protein n=1 Tax=Pleurocapsa sp. PCC 7319 TaxID=118161 RepID=UPI000346057A|nr:WGxxGxxG family protein [Pleurocapsa sp. PCC 7319]